MKLEAVASKRSRVHTRYYTKSGRLVPGVTTITGQLDKPGLINWANQLGLQGHDCNKYRDVLAEIGTIAHAMVLSHWKNESFKSDNIAGDLIDKAENSFLSYLQWEKGHKVEPILCEVALVSENLLYGGTMDFYGKIDGKLAVLDLKSGKGIYTEHWYQVGGYRGLLIENGHDVEQCRVLNIPRTENEEFSDPPPRINTAIEQAIFGHLLEIYHLRKLVG
jgi:hypothetical protein